MALRRAARQAHRLASGLVPPCRQPAAGCARPFASAPDPPPQQRPSRGAALAAAARARAQSGAASSALYLGALAVGMVGATYASVPLYRLFCQATGFAGTTSRVAAVAADVAARPPGAPPGREITVTFNADTAEGMPWRFVPSQKSLVVRPGETALAFYTATNGSSEPVTGVSTYNVSPMRAGAHFAKVQCFCFEEQQLGPGESVDLPVLFYLDPAFEEDRGCAGVNTLTLSYTFWRVDGAAANRRALDAALEAEAAKPWDYGDEGGEAVAADAVAGKDQERVAPRPAPAHHAMPVRATMPPPLPPPAAVAVAVT